MDEMALSFNLIEVIPRERWSIHCIVFSSKRMSGRDLFFYGHPVGEETAIGRGLLSVTNFFKFLTLPGTMCLFYFKEYYPTHGQ